MSHATPSRPADVAPCPCCGSRRGVVHIHGHGQCASCGTNIEPCCAGDNGNDAATKSANANCTPANPAPQLFPLIFDGLGGRAATVTTDALLFALSNRLGSDYEQARLVLEAAERVGIIRSDPPGLHRLQDVAASAVDPPADSL